MVLSLRRAHRVRLSFEKSGDTLDGKSLILDTELIRYKWRGIDGNYPDYEKLIPTDFNTLVSFDTNEAIKAVNSLKVLSDSKTYPIDLTIGNGKLTMSSPDDKGQTEIPADTQGEGKIRLDGSYLADALRACGGMVELKLVDSTSPMLFASTDYELVVMPMFSGESQKPKVETKTTEPAKVEASQPAETDKSEAETTEREAEKAQAIAEAEAITKVQKPKPKRKHKAKIPVAV
jgi:DNA polymerase III subunit beta